MELEKNSWLRYVLQCQRLAYLDISTGSSLLAQFRTAVDMHAKHQAFFVKYTARFPPDVVSKWEAAVRAWEANPSRKNPYAELEVGRPSCISGTARPLMLFLRNFVESCSRRAGTRGV